MTRAGLPRRPVRLAVVGLALAVALGGCLADAPTPEPVASPTLKPDPTPVVTTFDLDTTVWYGGFVIVVGRATATLDAKGGPVAVALTLENPGDTEATLDGPIRLTSGDAVVEPTRETDLPAIPAAGRADAVVTFEIDQTFVLAEAAVRIGRDTEHQAIVPLVSGPETAAVTLEPLIIEIAAEGQAGAVLVDVYRLELRADLPDWDQELPSDVLALTLFYHATFRSDFPGGASFTTDNVALRLPDGETIGPRRDGRSHSIALLRPNRRNTISTRFEVPVPGGGRYGFIVRDGSAWKVIPIDIVLP
ncbi:MAG TPA: hypothetical protein VFO50_02780 [Candidatus Limnocylindrales bacterium]|nr:hypothetical protein [Candidatus Limnocylindrales bacterium]